MTRINLGILPQELCDQHLIAEYRELPRLWRYLESPPRPIQGGFRLGAGHVLWCAAHLGTMARRYESLVTEMMFRDFVPRYPSAPEEAHLGGTVPERELERARGLLIARIRERLAGMSPRWTRRDPPTWAGEISSYPEKT